MSRRNKEIMRNRRVISRISWTSIVFAIICAIFFVSPTEGAPIQWWLLVVAIILAIAGVSGLCLLENTSEPDSYYDMYER